MKKLKINWELRTDGKTISDDLEEFRKNGGVEDFLAFCHEMERKELERILLH